MEQIRADIAAAVAFNAAVPADAHSLLAVFSRPVVLAPL